MSKFEEVLKLSQPYSPLLVNMVFNFILMISYNFIKLFFEFICYCLVELLNPFLPIRIFLLTNHLVFLYLKQILCLYGLSESDNQDWYKHKDNDYQLHPLIDKVPNK